MSLTGCNVKFIEKVEPESTESSSENFGNIIIESSKTESSETIKNETKEDISTEKNTSSSEESSSSSIESSQQPSQTEQPSTQKPGSFEYSNTQTDSRTEDSSSQQTNQNTTSSQEPSSSYQQPSEPVDNYDGIPYPSNASSTSVNIGVEFADVNISLTVRKDGTQISNGPDRISNSTGYYSLGTLNKGATIKCTGIGRNGYVRVEYNGQTGFIDSKNVEY